MRRVSASRASSAATVVTRPTVEQRDRAAGGGQRAGAGRADPVGRGGAGDEGRGAGRSPVGLAAHRAEPRHPGVGDEAHAGVDHRRTVAGERAGDAGRPRSGVVTRSPWAPNPRAIAA